MTTISVFGLGYVGCVSAACLAREGHTIQGVDVSESKVALLNSGIATVVEPGLAELVAEMHGAGRLTATTSPEKAVLETDISLVCVGTPSRRNGSLDLSHIEKVCTEIGAAMRKKQGRHIVVIRSTVLPGTTAELVIPVLERASGLASGKDFGVAMNPEFLREASSLKDFFDPPFTVIGSDDRGIAESVATLYTGIKAPLHLVPTAVAEMLKYVCNCFHGLKVGFANEIGSLCKVLGIDSHEVMRIFVEDRKLNISPAYLTPGFAFGGSCLPKDLRAVTYRARELDVPTPILSATLESNEQQVARAFEAIMATRARRIGILGLAFKHGTDDLRESPMVSLIERLIGKGLEVSVFDRQVTRARVIGANKEYVEREVPHIWSLVRESMDDVLRASEIIVIGNRSPEFRTIEDRVRADQRILDLVRIFDGRRSDGSRYEGIAW